MPFTKLVCVWEREIICINFTCNLLLYFRKDLRCLRRLYFGYINMYRYALILYPFHMYFNPCHWLNSLHWDKDICQIYKVPYMCKISLLFLPDKAQLVNKAKPLFIDWDWKISSNTEERINCSLVLIAL